MDAHFNEYLAAVAGWAEVYGERSDDAHAVSKLVSGPSGNYNRVEYKMVIPCIQHVGMRGNPWPAVSSERPPF